MGMLKKRTPLDRSRERSQGNRVQTLRLPRARTYQRPDEHEADQQQHAANQRAHPADRVAED